MSPKRDRFAQLIAAAAGGKQIDWAALRASATSAADRRLLETLKTAAVLRTPRRARSRTLPDTAQGKRSAVAATPEIESRAAGLRGRRFRWGQLEVFESLGHGSFGDVYRAFDPELQRDVALKLFKSDASPVDTLISKALREAGNLATIRHPNVVTVHGVECKNRRWGMKLEYICGSTLAELVEFQGRLSATEAALIGLQICRALEAVHSAGLVHRDVKLANVMREEGGRIVLMDFGAAHASD